jgi:predicted nucleic acid-binding protein
MRIYIDTSVINGLYTKDERIKDITNRFFHYVKFGRFTLYGSEIVSIEIKNTPNPEKRKLLIEVIEEYPIEILPITEEVKTLARNYCVENKIIPVKYIADALHIACCVIHNIPVLVSWNFKHIVKHKTRVEINRINQKLNLPQIDLCSPEEV